MKPEACPKFSHLDASGKAQMVDVHSKPVVHRLAVAAGELRCATATLRLLKENALPKGDVLAVARVAGIQAAKRTSELIPLCHPLPLHHVTIEFEINEDTIKVICQTVTEARTGVEMEALAGASVAALTLYDMMKAVDKGMSINALRVLRKEKK